MQQQQQLEIEIMRMKAKQDLQSIFLLVSLFMGFCFLFNSNITFGWDYKVIIVYASTAQFAFMVSKLLSTKGYDFVYTNRISSYCCFTVLESTLLITYLLGIVYNKEVSPININFISYTLLVFQFVILAITVLISRTSLENSNQEQSKQIQEILVSAIKSIAALQIVFVSLKWSDQISWRWMQTLIIVWFSIAIMALIEICLFVDLLMKCCNSKLENRTPLIYGSVWVNLIFFGFIIISASTFIGLGLLLDYGFSSINLIAYILTILYYGLEGVFYCKNKEVLIQFLNISENQTSSEEQQPNEQNTFKERMKQIHRISISKVPQFMVKLSATYFRKQEQNEDQKQQIASVLSQDKKFRSISFSEIRKPEAIKKSPSQDFDEDLTKKFDQLLSSPRLKLEVSESMGPELSSRCGIQRPNQQCLVCYEKESNMINQPCGHGGLCQECSEQLLSKSDLCYLCRKAVTHTLIVQGVQNRESVVEVVGMLQGGQK